MQNVSAGDVYFLTSPFHSTVSAQHEKKLAYLLGTVSARPVVIIRPPIFWDEYSTVDVIPSLSNGKPGITLTLNDRFGYQCIADYTFMPHTTHSVPIGRLGRYIGRLTDSEYEQIMYAYHWVHDRRMMEHPEQYPIPECYKEVMKMDTSSVRVFAARARECRLSVDHNMVLHADGNGTKDLDGVAISVNFARSITPTVACKLESDPNYHPAEPTQPAPPPEQAAPAPQSKPAQEEKPVNAPAPINFPPSIFDTDTLTRVAKDYTLHNKYYPGPKQLAVRDPAVITADELKEIRGEVGASRMMDLVAYYLTFTPFDAWCLGPYLPTSTLAKMSGFTIRETSAIKRLCTFFKNMSENEYQRRIGSAEPEAAPASTTPTASTTAPTQVQIRDAILKLTPYLNEGKMTKIPQKLQQEFLMLPKYAVKRAYTGTAKSFEKVYSESRGLYAKEDK